MAVCTDGSEQKNNGKFSVVLLGRGEHGRFLQPEGHAISDGVKTDFKQNPIWKHDGTLCGRRFANAEINLIEV